MYSHENYSTIYTTLTRTGKFSMTKKALHQIADKTPMAFLRILMNLWPPFLGAGIRAKKFSPDFRHAEVSMKLRWYNKNYVGYHYGGSLYSMTDPFHMLMLIRNLGKHYIVWDKEGRIEYKKPGKGLVKATFDLSEEEINHVREQADTHGKYIFDQSVDVIDEEGEVVASIVKTIYVRRKK